jgi:hypothetical protein
MAGRRMLIENPAHHTKRGRTVARRAKRKNPRRKRKNARKRRNGPPSWLKNFAGPKKRHKRRSNPRHHAKKRRNGHRRRRNPSFASLLPIFKAAGAGVVVGLIGTNLINSVLSSQSANVKTLGLAGAAAGAAMLLPGSPVLAAGIATGLLLVPGQQLLAGILPASFLNLGGAPAAPVLTAGGAPAAGPPATGWLNPRMGYLNSPALRGMGGLAAAGGNDGLATMGIGRRGA